MDLLIACAGLGLLYAATRKAGSTSLSWALFRWRMGRLLVAFTVIALIVTAIRLASGA